MARIFISYRRDDTQGEARHLAESLEKHVGKGKVFLDVEGIKPGLNFRQVLQGSVMRSDCLLALIGPNWLDIEDRATKKRRLENPDDLVRKEIGAALKRKIPVTPVLFKDVVMPEKEQLPDELKELADLQNFRLRHDRWNDDVKELANRLRLESFRLPIMGKLSTARRTLAEVAAALVFLSVVGHSMVGQYQAEQKFKELLAKVDAQDQEIEDLKKPKPPIEGEVVEGLFDRYEDNLVWMKVKENPIPIKLTLYGVSNVNSEIAKLWMDKHLNRLSCRVVKSSNGIPPISRCLAANTFDLSEALLLNGGAEALLDAPPSYREARDQFVANQKKIRNHSH